MAEIIKYEEPQLPALPEKVMPPINELVASLGIPREMLASDEEIEYAWKDLPKRIKANPTRVARRIGGTHVCRS